MPLSTSPKTNGGNREGSAFQLPHLSVEPICDLFTGVPWPSLSPCAEFFRLHLASKQSRGPSCKRSPMGSRSAWHPVTWQAGPSKRLAAWCNTISHYRSTRSRKAGQVLLAPRRVGTMTLFPHYFSEEVVPSAVRRTQRPPRIVLRMFHPADGENSGASLGGPVVRNGITLDGRQVQLPTTRRSNGPQLGVRSLPAGPYVIRTA